ncbi:MAG: dTDP-4-dehydrorhamnose reductase [Nitrospirota bacterium]|nr:dTDP-4-dehydrorhamnose reductase [Nitrospirota bacterium]
MRILITGADGQLGHELQQTLSRHDLTLGIYPTFDLLKPEVESFVMDACPDVVIHAAAYTNVEQAEQEPDVAMSVNADGTERVARAVSKIGARLICLSTDYVFDGQKKVPYEETDPTNPLNAYGRSKLEGERRALACCSNTLIIRTAWLYGLHGNNFVKTIMQRAVEQKELRVVADQRGCPTHAGDLAAVIAQVVKIDLRGIAHATGDGSCTWYEFASKIVALMGVAIAVRPITTEEARRAAVRPPYTVLANRTLAQLGITMPHWEDALVRFMQEMRAAAC